MADIAITCSKCSTIITVSEFVDPDAIVCHQCGAKLEKPSENSARPPKPTVRILARTEGAQAVAAESSVEEWRFTKHIRSSREEAGRGPSTEASAHHLLSWVLFAVLAVAMGFLRYAGRTPEAYLDIIKMYGPFAALALHVMVVLLAFKHSVYSGILSVLIPPYAYYFLFAVADEFYLRAVVAGLHVGIGQDSFLFFQRECGTLYDAVTHWIASGG